ncbi:thioredoxin family protein [Cellulomonas sp. zg-ZUI188]|uniref:Thioredoxin family protein n=1 Tax=Cellulomonas fengjieae TaxID=2819978 RepID=A0ABS3SF24_9CELL|nr:thioredoxin family protein [Cellulomonas fengjieae]QVI67299.1 thioredoxin family protein [Cellulomonas fengjieae]
MTTVRLTAEDLGVQLGERATVVQFSSTFCAPCRSTRYVVQRAVATADGVAYADLDIADHLALGERLGIDVTPTVLVLDARGQLVRRASGVPTLAQLRTALDDASSLVGPG